MIGPCRVKIFLVHANNKGADQTAHMCSLLSAFVIRFLEGIITDLAACKISIHLLVSVAEKTELRFAWLRTP